MADAASIADRTLARLVEDVETAQSRLRAYLAEAGRVPGAGRSRGGVEWPASATHPDLMTVPEAARWAGRSPDTIGRWCRKRDIGKMYGSRWRVSATRLDAIIR